MNITGRGCVSYQHARVQRLGDEGQGLMPNVRPALNAPIPTRLCSTPQTQTLNSRHQKPRNQKPNILHLSDPNCAPCFEKPLNPELQGDLKVGANKATQNLSSLTRKP